MRVLIKVAGHGAVPDANVPALETALEALRTAAAGVGMNLRVDLQLTEPDVVVVPPPIEPPVEPPPEGGTTAAKAPAKK